ncbi:MAG TPA: cytochrome c [Saprospiraceae bacterium]|nr:cytochrome c [Saprospiraceae bacterium]HMU04295.1 cytochrome c [Saprospiraceae bacterium]
MTKYIIVIIMASFIIACANKDNKPKETSSSTTETVALDGQKIYKQNCALCHGPDGKLGANGSKDLTISDFDLNERIAMITKGKGVMTAFENILTLPEIKAVAEYSMTLSQAK